MRSCSPWARRRGSKRPSAAPSAPISICVPSHRRRRGRLPHALSRSAAFARELPAEPVMLTARRTSSCRCSTSSSTTPWTSARRRARSRCGSLLSRPGAVIEVDNPGPPLPATARRQAVRVAVAVPRGRGQPAAFRAGPVHRAADRRVSRRRGCRRQPRGRQRGSLERAARPLRPARFRTGQRAARDYRGAARTRAFSKAYRLRYRIPSVRRRGVGKTPRAA